MRELIGKFRGKVEANDDSFNLGRIKVSVPDALGEVVSWAMPCVPYAGNGVGFFAIPPVGANIWVEFEGGNPDHPIWSGCFWERGEVPAQPAKAGIKVLKTDVSTITLNDESSGITIEATSGVKIEIKGKEIEITNGQGASIKLKGNKVSINGNALEVE